MFFSKEAEKFLNASGARGALQKDSGRQERSMERSNRFHEKGDRSHYAEGGDVEEKRKGMRVHRKHKDEGGEVEEKKKRGKRVHARSHHADMSEVEKHDEGGDVEAKRHGYRVGRKHKDEGGDVEAKRHGYRVGRKHKDEGGDVEAKRHGCAVGRKYRDEGGDVEAKRKGRRV